MTDRDPRAAEGDGQYRPFDDPRHPSWYSDSRDAGSAAQDPHATQNPYADQPLNGPYGDGRPQYPIDGGYPVVTNSPVSHSPVSHSPWDRRGGPARQPGTPYPTGPGGPGGPHGGQASGVAIASLVLGIVGIVTGGFLLVPQVLAIILGHVGLRHGRTSRGFAIAGLIMGYLVTGLWLLGIVGFMGLALFAY